MVERYNCPPMSDQKPEPDGCMVYASDYDALAAELAKLKADHAQYVEWAEPQIVTHGDDTLRIAALEAALCTYGAHRPSCPRSARPPGDKSCTCGLHETLASKGAEHG